MYLDAVGAAADALAPRLHMTHQEVSDVLLTLCLMDEAGARLDDVARLLCSSPYAEGIGFCARFPPALARFAAGGERGGDDGEEVGGTG